MSVKVKQLEGPYIAILPTQWLITTPMKDKQLEGPFTAISPTQWPISMPHEGKTARVPIYSYFVYTVAH
jgi:hypothetical protein